MQQARRRRWTKRRGALGSGGGGAGGARGGGAWEWRAAHEALSRLARQRAGLDFEEGTWLLAAQRAGVHARLGYGSFFEYIERLFGYSPRLTHDKLRVAAALKDLPQLAQALREGAATWSSVRELTRVGSLDDDAALLLMARHVLGGPVDEGRASYQVAITVCEACQRTTQTGRGEGVEVTADVTVMARCDAQILPRAHVGETDRA